MNILKIVLYSIFFFSCCILSCNTTSKVNTYSYLALGDSYTIGEGVKTNERWPNQLADSLTNSGFTIEKVNILAKTGWTTRNLLDAIYETHFERHTIVSLLIGVNNQYQRKPFTVFQEEFVTLLDTCIGLASKKSNVFVVSIPDYSVTPFGNDNKTQIALEINQYNKYIQETCSAKGVLFINITEISRELSEDSKALVNDGLHPSGYQYSQWTKQMFPHVLKLLKK